MSQALNRYRADLREMRFVLLEQFELGKRMGHGAFEDWGEEEVVAVLNEAYRYATEVAGPLNGVGDREGCRLEEGQVKTPSGFAAAYQQLYAGGFKSLTIAPEFGGAQAPNSLYHLVNELTSGPNASLDMYGGLTLGAADVVEHFGMEDQRQRYCPNMYDGTWAGTMCLTEPHAGSDVGEATTSAKRLDDGQYQIRGQKIFISGGDQDITPNIIHLVLARVEGAPPGTKGLSLFIVPKRRADGADNGVRVTGIEHKMGLTGSATCSLSFGDEADCVGELVGTNENQGIRQMFQLMNFARMGVAIQGLAAGSAAYLNALDYARERKQGAAADAGKDPTAPRVPIIEHPDIRRALLEMKAKVEGSRAMIIKVGHHLDCAAQATDDEQKSYHLGQVELLTPLCKSYASDQAFRISDMAIQVYGGAGYTKDYPVEQYCRDAKVFAIYEGTNHIQALDLVGRKLQQAKGANTKAFFRDIQVFVETHQDHACLGEAVHLLGSVAKSVAGVAQKFAEWGEKGELRRIPLVATPFLNLMSELCVGWLLLDAAVTAHAALESAAQDHPDCDFYRGKIQSALYFAHWFVAPLSAQAQTMVAAPPVPLEVQPEQFATI